MMKEATRLIRSESISSLLLYLQEMDVDRVRDDVKAEALAKDSLKYAKICQKCYILLNCKSKCSMKK